MEKKWEKISLSINLFFCDERRIILKKIAGYMNTLQALWIT
jgi:hypothetical protein